MTVTVKEIISDAKDSIKKHVWLLFERAKNLNSKWAEFIYYFHHVQIPIKPMNLWI